VQIVLKSGNLNLLEPSGHVQTCNEIALLTYLLTPWSKVLLEKLTVNFAASQEIYRIYETRKFLTVPTSACPLLWVILNMYFLRRGVVSTSPKPQARGPPLVGCPRLLIQFIHSYPPYRRPFLHPQPEDAPCRGHRDPHSWNGIALPFLYALCNMQIAYSAKPNYCLTPLTHNGQWCPLWCDFRLSIRIEFEFCIILLSSI
jgi:hypothetical protein